MVRQRAQEQSDHSMTNSERFSDRAQTVRVSNSRDTRPKGKCAQNKTHLCGTCRKIHDVSERLTNSNYKHDKHPKRALVYDTTTRARQPLGLPHFLAKNLVPRFSAYEMRTDPWTWGRSNRIGCILIPNGIPFSLVPTQRNRDGAFAWRCSHRDTTSPCLAIGI